MLSEPETIPDQGVGQSMISTKPRLRKALLIAGPAAVAVVALGFYLFGGRYESTDDAYLQSGQVAVATKISGAVVSVDVVENQIVRHGKVLFRIDPAPYKAVVAEAEAKLADARTQIAALQATYRKDQAQIKDAQQRRTYAVREAERQKALLTEGISSQAQFDRADLAVQTEQQAVETAEQQGESIRATLSGDVDAPIDSQPAVQSARAALDRALLNLSYTVVVASEDGIVTRVNQLQVGDYVSSAKPVFTLVSRNIWVEANFKETQLHYMRLGQPATIEVDAYPGVKLKAKLTSFSPGTGNLFSLLPPENATGNWVKVIQRLPVQFTIVELPKNVALHAGLSAEVTVDTGHTRLLGSDDQVADSP